MHVLYGGKPSQNVRNLGFLNLTAVDSVTSLHNSAELRNFRLAAKQHMLSNWG